MTQFNLKRLANQRVVVSGTDVFGVDGQQVLSTVQWDEVTHRDTVAVAQAKFDEALSTFFAPLDQAMDEIASSLNGESDDPIGYIVVDEGNDATPGKPRRVVTLTQDSIVLRLLENNEEERLCWVDGKLEVLALDNTVQQALTPDTEVALADAVATVAAELGGTEVNPDPTVFGTPQ